MKLTNEFDSGSVVQMVFDREDPSAMMDLKRMLKSTDLALALLDIERIVRAACKSSHTDVVFNIYDKMRAEYYAILDDHGINLDELLE